jgi:lipopolysaccharide export system permease protein
MRILTRHLIRAHVGPFFFALSALTGLLFLNAVAQRMADLAGKGLEWTVILEFLMLSLPHTVALTLPMAVLVAVLHAFTEMTAANEITAIKAGGIPPKRILAPLLVAGTLMGGVMLFFNDQVLPEANHRLKNLLLDINRKDPTFSLREQVVNRVQAGESGHTYFISASSIDNAASRLEGVKIVDATDLVRRRTTYADSGFMAFNEARTDLYLTLYDGVLLELDPDRPGGFQKVFFDKQLVPLRGIGNEMDRAARVSERGDREMTIGMLNAQAREQGDRMAELRTHHRERTVQAVREGLGLAVDSAATVAASDGPGGSRFASQATTAGRDPVTQRAQLSATTSLSRLQSLQTTQNRYEVELHKKYTLAFACIVFVLLGIPLAIRFPRGGLGLVIAASSVIFAVYWVGLIAGEDLADRGIAPPAVTMWVPNLVFTALGIWMVARMGREAATMRGGGWDDLWWTLRRLITRKSEQDLVESDEPTPAPREAAA